MCVPMTHGMETRCITNEMVKTAVGTTENDEACWRLQRTIGKRNGSVKSADAMRRCRKMVSRKKWSWAGHTHREKMHKFWTEQLEKTFKFFLPSLFACLEFFYHLVIHKIESLGINLLAFIIHGLGIITFRPGLRYNLCRSLLVLIHQPSLLHITPYIFLRIILSHHKCLSLSVTFRVQVSYVFTGRSTTVYTRAFV